MKVKILSAMSGLFLGGWLLVAGFASADTITTPVVGYGPEDTNWNTTISVDKFDSTLGTLTGINIILDGQVTSIIDIFNTSTNPIDVTYNLSAIISLWYNDTTKLAETIPLFNGAATVEAGGHEQFNGNGNALTNTGVSSSFFDEFSSDGGGTLALNLKASTVSQSGATGSYTIGFDTSALLSASIIYTYDPTSNPVPEPATMFLFGTGIVGLLGFGRRKLFKR